MNYETLLYEQAEHVVTLTYNRPDQHNAVDRIDERRAASRLGALPRRRRRVRSRDHRRRRDDLLRRLGSAGRGGSKRDRRLRRLPRQPLQQPRRVRLHAQGRHLQAGDRSGERVRVRCRARDGAAGGHSHRCGERRVRCARATLEHRRRRWHDSAAAAGRRLRQGDGAGDHWAPHRRGGGVPDRPRQRDRAPRRCAAASPGARARDRRAARRERSAATRRASCGASAARSRNACGSRRRW